MSEEDNDPKPAGGSVDPASDEGAAAAREAAKDFANNAGAMIQGLDQKMQIYLVALAVTLVCALFFNAITVKSKAAAEISKSVAEMASAMTGEKVEADGRVAKLKAGTITNIGSFWGTLALLGAAGGIGILIWSTVAKRKDAWIPLALAGTAGAAALGVLLVRFGHGWGWGWDSSSNVDGTLLGWWVPLAAAAVATTVSVQRILKA